MNFSDAMKVVLKGGKARRDDWHRPSHIEVRHLERGNLYVAMVMKDGAVGPYPPSHCDMLAKDWAEVR